MASVIVRLMRPPASPQALDPRAEMPVNHEFGEGLPQLQYRFPKNVARMERSAIRAGPSILSGFHFVPPGLRSLIRTPRRL